MARPPLRIGQHGRITRTPTSTAGVWEASCWVRDIDGVRRRARRSSPPDRQPDRHGLAAEHALRDHLAERTGGADGAVTSSTLVKDLLKRHMTELEKAGRAHNTIDTYALRVGYWNTVASGLRVADCTPGRIDTLLGRVRDEHGDTTTKQLRTLLSAALNYAVLEGVLTTNPVTAVKPVPRKRTSSAKKGASPVDVADLPAVLAALTASEECREKDLTDPILMHVATGLRVSEILGLRWAEFDPQTSTLAVTGRVVRAKGKGLLRVPTADSTKGTPDLISLPSFATALLVARAAEPRPGGLDLIFPSSVGTLRDINNFAKQWRGVRANLGVALEKSTGHSFRKTLGNLVTDSTADVRIAADVLGHSDTRTTLKHYLSRNKVHPEVAALIDAAVIPPKSPESGRLMDGEGGSRVASLPRNTV